MRALRILVVVMGVMIVAGVAVVVVTIAKRAGLGGGERAPVAVAPGAPAAVDFGAVPVALPPGARLVGEMAAGGDLVLKARLAGGEVRYIVVDLATGRTRGTLQVVETP